MFFCFYKKMCNFVPCKAKLAEDDKEKDSTNAACHTVARGMRVCICAG